MNTDHSPAPSPVAGGFVSQWHYLTSSVRRATPLWLDLLREQAVPLLVLFAITQALSLTIEDLMQHLSRDEETQRGALQLGLGLVDFVGGVVQILMLSWGVPKVRELTEAHFQKKPFETSYLNSFLAEYLRTLASVLLWAILLIVPGLVRYVRLIYVPFITLFAKPYRDGSVDAFELSMALTRGRRGLLGVVVVLSMAVQFGFELLPQGETFHALPWRLACGAAGFLIAAWVFALTFAMFERAMEEHQWT